MGPYIKSKKSINTSIINIIISLIPIIIYSIIKIGIIPYTKGDKNVLFYPLLIILITTICMYIFDTIYSFIFKKKDIKKILNENKSIYPALLLALLIPIKTPLLLIILATFISSTVKMISNKINFRINGVVVGTLITLIILKVMGIYTNSFEVMGTYENLVKPYGNITKMIIGIPKETLGEVSTLLCSIGFIFLTLMKSIKWRIPLTYLLTIFGVTYVIGGMNDLGLWYPIYQVIAGGLVFTGIFVISDNQTTPTTPIGQILFGIFTGILTVIFTYLLPLHVGALLSIILMNLFVPIIDKIGTYARFNFKVTIIPFVIAWLLILILSIVLSIKL